jgi:hypothetical protein
MIPVIIYDFTYGMNKVKKRKVVVTVFIEA